MAEAHRDNKTARIDRASPLGCIFARCIPEQVQARPAESNEKCAEGIPNPLCSTKSFWLSGSRSWRWPLLQFVAICCSLFTNCCTRFLEARKLQTVHKLFADCCTRQKSVGSISRQVCAISVVLSP